MKKIFSIIVSLFVSVYLICIGYFYFWQEKIIFHPERTYHPPPKSLSIKQHFISYGKNDSLHVWHLENNSFYPTVLYFSGNSFNISHRNFHIDLFKNLGLNAVMFDYRGYGSSSGSIDSKDSFYESGAMAFDFMLNKLKIPKDQIIFWGHSLGGPISAKTLGITKIRAIVLESPVTSIEDIGNRLYPFFPISYILKYDFNTYEHINNNKSPILLIHSKDDDTVPFLFAENLFQNIERNNKKFLVINGSHRLGSYDSFPRYYDGIKMFLKSKN